MAKIGKVMELPSQIVSALTFSSPTQPDTTNHWFTQVTSAFESQLLCNTWSTFNDRIDHHTITYLKIHAQLLQANTKTKTLNAEALDSAKLGLKEVLELLLQDENIDKNVRVSLSRNIRKLINALEEYKLTGCAGIFDSIEILVGHAYFDPKYGEIIRKSTIGEKVTNIVSALADSMAVILGLPQAADSVKELLSYVKAAT